ncbi:hypothetical protein GCM10020366_69960 [Saccharopolyspora gregorii]|uniref:Uncharacterized protein n=1 Tax=Saccharopolyspora gregorii TaxID=33914 RepID=A0ABP6S2S0_9PSEU
MHQQRHFPGPHPRVVEQRDAVHAGLVGEHGGGAGGEGVGGEVGSVHPGSREGGEQIAGRTC